VVLVRISQDAPDPGRGGFCSLVVLEY
jgi:hypothetical protein